MANCSCSGNSGSTYATANRSGYGCLSSVPTSSGIAYNCFLPPTNQAYYQNFPFYNGPCGSVAGENDSDGCNCNTNCGCNNNCCNSCNSCNSCGSCNGDSDSCNSCNCNNNCCCSTSRTMFCNCPCNLCCGPAAALAATSGSVTTGAGAAVPISLVAQASDSSIPPALASVVGPISVMSDSIIFNCAGTYLVTLTVHLPDGTTYTGTIGLTANGAAVSSSIQDITLTTGGYDGTSQALIRVAEGATMTINTSAALTATADSQNIITVSIVRIA